MDANTAACFINVAIASAVAVACYATGSGLPLFGLLFLMTTRTKAKKCSCKDDKEQSAA